MSKIKCFIYHKNKHYASQCSEKKGKGKQQHQVAVSTETQMKEYASKFKKDFSMVSCLFSSTVPKNAWYVNSGASRHIISSRELFLSLKEHVSRVQVELGDDAKYPIARVGTILLQLRSGNSLDFDSVLFVPSLKKNLLLVWLWKIRAL